MKPVFIFDPSAYQQIRAFDGILNIRRGAFMTYEGREREVWDVHETARGIQVELVPIDPRAVEHILTAAATLAGEFRNGFGAKQ